MRAVAVVALTGCWTAAPPPVAVEPPATPTLDTPAWPAGEQLDVHWTIASETPSEATVEFRIGAVARQLTLGHAGEHVWPQHQSVCYRRLGLTGDLAQLESEGDFAKLVFTNDHERHVGYRVRRVRPDLLEVVRVQGGRRTRIATVPIPARVELTESIEDFDGHLNTNNLENYSCGMDDGGP